MKDSLSLLLFISVCLVVGACTDLTSSDSLVVRPAIAAQPRPTDTPLVGLDQLVLTKDFSLAKSALGQAILEKNLNTIRLALTCPFMDLRVAAAAAIGEIGDQPSVPFLVTALQNNQGVMSPSLEGQYSQSQFNRTLVTTLEGLTKLKFNATRRLLTDDLGEYLPLSDKEMQDVVDKISAWSKSQKRSGDNTCNDSLVVGPAIAAQPRPTDTPLVGLDRLVLNDDFSLAKSALDQAILEKNLGAIRLALNSRFRQFGVKAAAAIAEMGDRASVPFLVTALQGNRGYDALNTEGQVDKSEFNRTLVTALESLTKLQFHATRRLVADDLRQNKPLSDEEIQEIVDKVSAWSKPLGEGKRQK